MAPDPEPGPDGLVIEVSEEAGNWSAIDVSVRIPTIVEALSAREPAARGVVALALADDALVQDLNARFRGKDKPTNVLSFPSGEEAGIGVPLGDVVVAIETLDREASAEQKSPGKHFTHLVIHGILHLLGYDHETDEDAGRMERLETAILADLGIEDPYADPAIDAINP